MKLPRGGLNSCEYTLMSLVLLSCVSVCDRFCRMTWKVIRRTTSMWWRLVNRWWTSVHLGRTRTDFARNWTVYRDGRHLLMTSTTGSASAGPRLNNWNSTGLVLDGDNNGDNGSHNSINECFHCCFSNQLSASLSAEWSLCRQPSGSIVFGHAFTMCKIIIMIIFAVVKCCVWGHIGTDERVTNHPLNTAADWGAGMSVSPVQRVND